MVKLVPITQNEITLAPNKDEALRIYHEHLKKQRDEDKRNLAKLERMKPEFKAKMREYRQKPEVKAKMREYHRKYFQKPEVKAKMREYRQKPEVKAKMREYRQKPEFKAKMREYQQEYYKNRKSSGSQKDEKTGE